MKKIALIIAVAMVLCVGANLSAFADDKYRIAISIALPGVITQGGNPGSSSWNPASSTSGPRNIIAR